MRARGTVTVPEPMINSCTACQRIICPPWTLASVEFFGSFIATSWDENGGEWKEEGIRNVL
jgi:hypothetical protein